jgi:hypothetical protein
MGTYSAWAKRWSGAGNNHEFILEYRFQPNALVGRPSVDEGQIERAVEQGGHR